MGVMEAMSEASSAREEGEEDHPDEWDPRGSHRRGKKWKGRCWAVSGLLLDWRGRVSAGGENGLGPVGSGGFPKHFFVLFFFCLQTAIAV